MKTCLQDRYLVLPAQSRPRKLSSSNDAAIKRLLGLYQPSLLLVRPKRRVDYVVPPLYWIPPSPLKAFSASELSFNLPHFLD